MDKITKDTTLAEVMGDSEMNPAKRDGMKKRTQFSSPAQEILLKYNVPCLGCSFAQYEMKELKLGDICKMYSIDIKGLLKDLNKK